MKAPRAASALNELDDDLISDAIEYRPKQRRFFRWTKWKALAACLALAAAGAGVLPLCCQPALSPLVLTAYAREGDQGICASAMAEGEPIPVSLFETANGLKGFVFSYEAADPTQPACVLIRDMSGPAAGGESIGEMAGLEAEQGKIYIYYALAEDAAVPYNLPAFITDRENNAVYQFDIVIEESGDGDTAQLREVARYERKAAPSPLPEGFGMDKFMKGVVAADV